MACGGAVFRHADDHGPGGEASGLSDLAVSGMLSGKGSPVCRPYGQTHHPAGDGDQGDRTGAGRHARKRSAERLRAPVRRVEEREWLPIPDPSVHHPAGLGQAHVLVRDDAVLPTALLVEESDEVPLSLVVRCHPLGGRSDVRDARRCGGVILDSSDDQAEHVSLLATCHPTT